jgi:hypothetical protein
MEIEYLGRGAAQARHCEPENPLAATAQEARLGQSQRDHAARHLTSQAAAFGASQNRLDSSAGRRVAARENGHLASIASVLQRAQMRTVPVSRPRPGTAQLVSYVSQCCMVHGSNVRFNQPLRVAHLALSAGTGEVSSRPPPRDVAAVRACVSERARELLHALTTGSTEDLVRVGLLDAWHVELAEQTRIGDQATPQAASSLMTRAPPVLARLDVQCLAERQLNQCCTWGRCPPVVGGEAGQWHETCCVCLDAMHAGSFVGLLRCGHRLHRPCMLAYVMAKIGIAQAGQTPCISCPLCRADLTTNQ